MWRDFLWIVCYKFCGVVFIYGQFAVELRRIFVYGQCAVGVVVKFCLWTGSCSFCEFFSLNVCCKFWCVFFFNGECALSVVA